MIKYLLGWFKHLFNPAVSLFVKIDNHSTVNKKARINRGVSVLNSTIGKYSYVGSHTSIVHARIGSYCSIAGECHIGMATHTLGMLSTSPLFTERHNGVGYRWVESSSINPYKIVEVGNDVWIGLRVLVVGGVHIGDGAIIAAGSIVTKDVPPYAVVAGIPAKVIRYRFSDEIITELELLNWWSIPEHFLRRNIDLFQGTPDIDRIINTFGHYNK